MVLLLASLIVVSPMELENAVSRVEKAAVRAEMAAGRAVQSAELAFRSAEKAERIVSKMQASRAHRVPRAVRASVSSGYGTSDSHSLYGSEGSHVVTDASGDFRLDIVDGTTIVPKKLGGFCGAISSLDASYILQYVVGKRKFSPYQLLACDVSGNGSCSALDASWILKFVVGKISRFPAAELCGSDWLFVPNQALQDGVQIIATNPVLGGGTCTMGSMYYAFEDFTRELVGQNFAGVVLGDVTGNWRPCE